MIDYEIIRVIWWALIGVLLCGYAITDGFDLGVGALLPFIAKNDTERRIVINSVGPTWEGNQVWIILGGGAIFAAWPYVYAISFSGFYFAMLLVLFSFILRPVGFKYRSKMPGAKWRNFWDWALFVGGFVPALIFGVALGNVLQGVPFHFDDNLRSFYTGTFFGLLNPFGILAGLISVSMLIMHGANFLAVKTANDLHTRSINVARFSSFLFIVLFALAGYWIANGIDGYILPKSMSFVGPSNPLLKTAAKSSGAWMHNYHQYPWMIIAPIVAFVGALFVLILAGRGNGVIAFISSATCLTGVLCTFGFSMFPFILPSSSDPSQSLMVWDASSTQLTLNIMLIATVIFMPIILAYTTWVYRVMRGKVTAQTIIENTESY